MHISDKKQMPLMPFAIEHEKAREFDAVAEILSLNPIIYELALKDLTRNVKNKGAGANGMTAQQVVHAAIIKKKEDCSYEDLDFHINDSNTYKRFCQIGVADKGFKKSALGKNIKALSDESWEAIHRVLIKDADDKGIEKGKKVRIDCTAVLSNIHDPKDSTLLWDCARVLTRILNKGKDEFKDLNILFTDHTVRAKRRMLNIMNAKNEEARKEPYRDLLKVTSKAVSYAQSAVPLLKKYVSGDILQDCMARHMAEELEGYIPLALKVINQTERRVINDESVTASEKIFSIFESHTDIIIKDRRETFYGHKICITGGASNLILDCQILKGNPADSTLVEQMLDRQKEIYGNYPDKVALDGGFASKANLEYAKDKNIKEVCFAKKRGLEVEDMCSSKWVYDKLRKFRAGIESGISWLKRSFGLDLCTWKSWPSFKSYVWASIVTANLFTMARKKLVRA